MLEENLIDIIAVVAIVLLIVGYAVMKKKQNKDKPDVMVDEYAQETPAIETPVQETPKPQEEEKEVEVQEEETPNVQNSPVVAELIQRNKRAVPPHDKITKDKFVEFAGLNILVAEDNIINQKVLAGLLSDSGITLTMADDGQFALDILDYNSKFDFIFMDAHMPRVDGFEATRTIRQNRSLDHIVIVALSGDTAADDIKKMKQSGMEEYLEKPLKMDSLYDILYSHSKSRNSDQRESNQTLKTEEEIILNTNKGLAICGGDTDFYNEILDEFFTTYSKSHIKLRELISNKEIQQTAKYLLDISGTTANIGAVTLCKKTLNLKEAIDNPKENRYSMLYKDYAIALNTLLKEINIYRS